MRQVLAWAMAHDPALALRLANALGWWWFLRGRLAGEYRLLCQAADRAEAGSGGWCAAQIWLGLAALFSSDLAASARPFHRGPGRRRGPAAVPGADRRPGRPGNGPCGTWAGLPRRPATPAARWRWPGRSGTRPGRCWPWPSSVSTPIIAGDHAEAIRLARQAGQITAGIPGPLTRRCSSVLTIVLAGAGDLAEAARVGAAVLARARDAGDLWNQAALLPRIADLDLRAGRTGDAAAHLREGLRIAVRTGNWLQLRRRPVPVRGPVRRDRARRRSPHAVGRVCRDLPARGTYPIRPGSCPAGRNRCARPGRRWDLIGRGRPRTAARR